MTRMGLPRYMVLVFVLLSLYEPALGVCRDTTVGVNCSFETGEDCLQQYVKVDKYGLQWATGEGYVDSGFGYQYALQQSPQGRYMYIQGTGDERTHGIWTDLISPKVSIKNTGCLYFLFHNSVSGGRYDTSEIAFKVLLRPDYGNPKDIQNTNSDILLREYQCIESSAWQNTHIPVIGHSGTYRLVFSAKQHADSNQIVAVDRVIYTDNSCSILEDRASSVGDCDFEDPDLCGYTTTKESRRPVEWRMILSDMVESNSFSDQGTFLALMGDDRRQGSSLAHVQNHLESPPINMEVDGCLSVTYYNSRFFRQNEDIVALVVSKTTGSQTDKLSELPATLGNETLKAFVDLPRGQYSIKFTASVKPPYRQTSKELIALDDIEIHQTPCDDIRCESEACDTSGICGDHGRCIGRGLKHLTCQCTSRYYGKRCEFDTMDSTRKRNQWA